MRKSHLIVPALALLGLLSGCQIWQPGGARVPGKNNTFSITPPSGWMYSTAQGAELVASKEGPILQKLLVERTDLAAAAKAGKVAVRPGMSAFEAAEAMVGQLRANQDLQGFELRENVPAEVGGKPGFKLVFSYRTKDRLHLAEIRYGAVAGNDLWLVRYTAPARHYFERDAEVFEAAAKTFRIGGS